MWEQLQSVSDADWVWIGTAAGSMALGLLAALRGMKRSPVEVGMPVAPIDRTEYVLKEVRVLADRIHENHEEVTDRLDDHDKSLSRIYTDTQVIRALKGN